jgi:hypothetical protein
MIMKLTALAAALLLGCLLTACDQGAAPAAPPPAASSSAAPSTPVSTAPVQTQASESAWEKYKREVREAGFVNPNKDDGSISDDQTRQGAEAICHGPGGASGLVDLYKISIQMKPQQVDMLRIKRAAADFCASVGRGGR